MHGNAVDNSGTSEREIGFMQGNTILLRLCKLRYVGMDQYKVAKLLLEAHANPSVTDAEASGLQPLA